LDTLLEKTTNEPDCEPSTSSHVAYNLDLESSELAQIGSSRGQTNGLDVALKPSDFEVGPRVYGDADAKRWKAKVLKLTKESSCDPVC
jgi:hypothetical protein